MLNMQRWICCGVVMMLAVGVWAEQAEKVEDATWLAQANVTKEKFEDIQEAAPPAAAGWEKPIPVSFSLDYTLVSKYMWRGQDLTPDNNRMNHQMTLGLEADVAKLFGGTEGLLGNIGGSFWFQWNGGNEPEALQEVDYTVYWNYSIDAIGLGTEVGFIWYTFPGVAAANTQEIYGSLSWDDGILWKAVGLGDSAILNPTLALYMDTDEAAGGLWGEFGLSHDFALADMGLGETPVLKDMSFGVSWMMGWAMGYPNGDNAYYATDYNGSMTCTYGLTMNLDLKSMLEIPDQYCGDLYLGGFLNYSQAMAHSDIMANQLWGGMSIGYGW